MSIESYPVPELEELARLFPAYQLLELVAVGELGVVYKALQVSLEREVAIKILPDVLGKSSEVKNEFEEEAKNMARFNHANLISVIDFGEVQGLPYMIMEYVNGSTMHDAVNGMPVERVQSVELMVQVCSGIAYAHTIGVLHCDIRPANILLDQSFNAKVADFVLSSNAYAKSGEKGLWGMPGYLAPEVAGGIQFATAQSDIYSLGGVLYFLLTARDPEPSLVDYSQCDEVFHPILKKALATSPEDRYESAAAMSEDLKSVLFELEKSLTAAQQNMLHGGVPVSPVVHAPITVVAVPVGGSTPAHPGQGMSTFPLKQKSSVAKNVFYLLLLVVLVAGGVLVFLKREEYFFAKTKDAPKVDHGVKEILIPNFSFELKAEEPPEGEERSGDAPEVLGWRGQRLRQSFDYGVVPAMEGADGEQMLVVEDGIAYCKTDSFIEVGHTYILEFSIAKDGEKELVSDKQFKVNITVGNNTPVARFKTDDILPDRSAGMGMERYRITFDAKYRSNDFREPIGVRVVANYSRIYIDNIVLKYHKIKN